MRKAAYLFFILENTLLYILIGLIGGVMRIPPLVWFLMVPTIIVASTSVEFFAIRRWGDRFRMFGWHNIQKFGNTRFTLSAVYVALQTFSFLTLGYATSWLMYR